MRVELLHHVGCRSAHAVHRLLQECLTILAIPVPILVRVGHYPSPTVLVNGTDIMRPGTPLITGNACRLDIPTRDALLAALAAQLATESADEFANQER